MIGKHTKFTAQGLQSLPHVEDKHYKILGIGRIDDMLSEFIHDVKDFTHAILEGMGTVHIDHLNLPK